jgi:hypothetical protein
MVDGALDLVSVMVGGRLGACCTVACIEQIVMCRAGLKALSPALPGPLRPGPRQGLARAFSRLGPGSRSRKPKARGSSPGLITN